MYHGADGIFVFFIGNDHQCASHCDRRCAGYSVQTLSERALSGYNHQSHGLFRGVSGSGGNALQDTDGQARRNFEHRWLYAAIVAEKTTAKEQIETEIAALSDNISVLKEQLKSKKSALKVAVKELSKAEAKKVAAEKKAAEESKKAEAESVLKKLLASGMSADEIIAKLQ